MVIVASYGGRQPSRIFDPAVVGRPFVTTTSFIASGTPASGPSSSPAARFASTARGRGQRALGVDVQEGVHPLVGRGDAVQVRLRDLDGADLAGGDPRGGVGGGQLVQCGH